MHYTYTTLFFIWISVVDCSEKTPIPSHLTECYTWPPPSLLPMDLETMTEIIRKISFNNYGPLGLVQETSDILNWFSVEGLERSPNVVRKQTVVPYHRTGFQAHRQNLLYQKLIPIRRRAFQAHFLTVTEKCTLHFMVSSSVDYWERGDESKTCPNSHQEFRNMTADGSGGAGMYSVCPLERGVVLTPGGSVCIGRVLTALIAALMPQQVPLSQLMTPQQLITVGLQPTDTISNIWASTLAGDLAEVAVEQSPLYEKDVKIGIPERWNDTYIPSLLYFDSVQFKVIEKHQWQITDAEILGGIDGLLLGNMIQRLSNSVSNSLRLSQVLEMYYSNRSISQEQVCKRKSAFSDFIRGKEKTLIEQTKRIAALLGIKTTTYFIDRSIMAYRCINAVGIFIRYYPHLMMMDGFCPAESATLPKFNLYIILDATWPSYSSLQYLMLLTRSFDISYYGGSITVINGDSLVAAVNSTASPTFLYQQMRFGNHNDPKELILHKSLNAVKNMLEVKNIREQISPNPRIAKHDVVVILGYSSTIGDKDLKYSMDILKTIKSQNPAVQFIYITSPVNSQRFLQLVNVGKAPSSDAVISTDDAQAGNIISLLQTKLGSERLLKPAYCKSELHQWPEVWYNEYITPGQTNAYWIHPDYFYRSLDIVKINFKSYHHGELMVCMSRDTQRGDCKVVSCDVEVTHAVLRPCDTTADGHCLPLYFTVSVLRTFDKCAELDCRYPNQVKFSIIVQDLHCINVNAGVSSKASICFLKNFTRINNILIFTILTLVKFKLC